MASRQILGVGLSLFRNPLLQGTPRIINRQLQKLHCLQDPYLALGNRPHASTQRRFSELICRHDRAPLSTRQILLLGYHSAPEVKSPALSWFKLSELRNAIRTTYYQSARTRRVGYSGGNGSGWNPFKRFLSSVPSNWIFYGILGINVLVYGAWGWAQTYWEQFRDPSRLFFMLKHFTVSWDNFKQGRIWTLLTSCFSQSSTSHALMNGLTFYFMAPAVLNILGNARFLGLYLGGGLIASAVSLVWNHLTSRNPNYRSHGASGAILATTAFFACAFPTTQFLIFFIIPVPAWACMTGLFAWDLYSTIVQRQGSTIDSAGHVGGIVAGVLYCLRLRRRGLLL